MSRIASSKTARIWAERFAQCERSNAPVAQRTQGGASLCPGVRWARILPSPERAEPIGASTHTLTVPRAALRSALGYLILPLWGSGGSMVDRASPRVFSHNRTGHDNSPYAI
jgi:hypothetical protein